MTFTLADELLYTSINLTRVRDSQIVGTGTGFFWTEPVDELRSAVVIVTNKHVIEGCDAVIAVCHLADSSGAAPNGTFVNCSLAINESSVVHHPDPDVDLCAISFAGVIQQADERGTPIFYKTLKKDCVPASADWEKFDSIEEVLMIGCPQGIYDTFNNLPIVRRGITATPLGKRYGGRDEFMVDMACFPGSSGSPVFQSIRGYLDRERKTFLLDATRFFLLGVLYGGPTITNAGEIILSHRPRVEVASMMHLGHVIRSSALADMSPLIVERAI